MSFAIDEIPNNANNAIYAISNTIYMIPITLCLFANALEPNKKYDILPYLSLCLN